MLTVYAERDALLFASLQVDALETTQFLDGTCNGGCLLVDIELDHLVALALTRILHHDAGLDGTVSLHGGVAQRQVAIAEGGIGQTIAEGVEWVVAHLQIVAGILAILIEALLDRTTRVQVVIIKRNLSQCLWHSDREASAGSSIAEEHVGNGVASLRTCKPYVHNGVNVLLFPGKHSGTTREVQQYDGLANLDQFLQQFALGIRHLQCSTARRLATEVCTLAHSTDDDVGLLCNSQRLSLRFGSIHTGNGLAKLSSLLQVGIVRQVTALRIEQLGFGQSTLQRLLDGSIALWRIGYAPGTGNIRTVVGQWTDEGDGIISVEWQ